MFRMMRPLLTLLAMVPAFAAAPADGPLALRPEAGQTLLLQAHGVGDQVYSCTPGGNAGYAWTLKAPDARLLSAKGELLGHHFAGPSWEANDGSRVQAKPAANVPAPDPRSVPWLLLKVTSHQGQGILTPVTNIQRLNTKGGKAPAAGCDAAHADAVSRVPYEADYLFYGPASH